MFKDNLSIYFLCFLLIPSSSFGILYSPSQVSAHEASSSATPSAIPSLHAEHRLFKRFQLVFSLTLPLCDPASNSFISFLSFLSLQWVLRHYNIVLLMINYGGSKASLPGHFPLFFYHLASYYFYSLYCFFSEHL